MTSHAAIELRRELGPVYRFMQALWAADHELHSVSKRIARAVGLTGPQRFVLRVIGRFPGISAGDLAGMLSLHPSTLTGILHRLARRGIVERREDPGDRRRALLWLTERGRALNRPRALSIEAAVRRTLARIPRATVEHACRAFEALAEDLRGVAAEAAHERAPERPRRLA